MLTRKNQENAFWLRLNGSLKASLLQPAFPEDRAPIVKIAEGTGPTYNEPQLSERLAGAFRKALGEENVVKVAPIMASEDFGYLSLDQKIPATIFWLGASEPAKVKGKRRNGRSPSRSSFGALCAGA